jgi:type IV pilus assembly protein PilC
MAGAIVYQWAGKNARGEILKGAMTAGSKDAVQQQLSKQGITATSITEKKTVSLMDKLKAMAGGSVSDKDIVIFTRQFSTMIDAGLPLVQALDILSSQCENKTLAKVLVDVKGDVESGSTYADALKKHPKTFTDLYANMVAAGESGGILDTILNRLAAYMEKAAKLKGQIKGAMVYPITITGVATVVITVILVFVVPTISSMFDALGGTLPLPTQLVIDASHFLKTKGWLVVLAMVGLGFLMKKIRSTEKGLYITDGILLRLPVFGDMLNKVAISKFTRTMGTLTSSGVPLLDGLEITARTSGNKVIERAIMNVRQQVSEGKSLSEPLSKAKVFPPMVTHMIAVGETTGALDNMMAKIADFYDDEVDASVNNLMSLMEPLMMVFLGGAVGFIIVAMYLPIFKMITLIK